MLSFARRTHLMDRAMKQGMWQKTSGVSLAESTLGIIGVGNIGSEVARRARAFGMTILGNDLKLPSPDFIEQTGIKMVSKLELLRNSDFVTTNCDLNPTSIHILSDDDFAAMKPAAFVINTARGPLIDEEALIRALKNRKIAGAALDVFEHEPLSKDSPLLRMETVLLAPHNSNSSPAAWEKVHQNTIRNLLTGLREVQR
jgi:D-3-phosphoglycerate dehydrogenase